MWEGGCDVTIQCVGHHSEASPLRSASGNAGKQGYAKQGLCELARTTHRVVVFAAWLGGIGGKKGKYFALGNILLTLKSVL